LDVEKKDCQHGEAAQAVYACDIFPVSLHALQIGIIWVRLGMFIAL
jgi:hypothetical protein